MHTDLFEELPLQYYDSAFLDRIHFYIPGWEVEIIRGEMFTAGYGFVVDYLAEILRKLRTYDYTQHYQEHFRLSDEISTRDRDGVNKTFSGLMKILFPSGIASKEDIEMVFEFAIEGRKRVKDQLMRIDTTYPEVSFGYAKIEDGSQVSVKTAEEKQYPQHYYSKPEERPTPSERSVGKKPYQQKPIEPPMTEEERLIRAGENAKLEFKSSLRWNIKANRSDTAIEHSILKTIVAFLNTEGGTLLIGVEDSGNILGIGIDQFPNDDKFLLHFGNLMNDKIGKHYTDQIRWELKELSGKKILRVDCKPSSNPVFLRIDGKEEFYIRNGPSSLQLSTSEVLEYSRKHFR